MSALWCAVEDQEVCIKDTTKYTVMLWNYIIIQCEQYKINNMKMEEEMANNIQQRIAILVLGVSIQNFSYGVLISHKLYYF